MKNFFRTLLTNKDTLNRRDTITLTIGLVIFAAISLGNITRWSLWFDEAFGVYMTRFNVFGIAGYTATDVHPPFYYWILKAWEALFGSSELALRSLSLVAMMAAIVIVYLTVRRLFSWQVSTWALGCIVLSPLLVRYSEEARMYGPATLIVAGATYVLVRATERPTTRKWIIYAILVALGMWTHYFTALMWLAHWVWRYAILRTGSAHKTRKLFWSKPWIGAHILAVVLFLPWLPFMLKQMTNVQGGGFWIPPVSASTPTSFLTTLFTFRDATETTGWLALLIFVVVALTGLLYVKVAPHLIGRKKQMIQLLAIMTVVPATLLVLLSMPPLRPAFVDRYLIPSVPYFFALIGILVGLGIREKRTKWLSAVVAVLVTVLSIVGIVHVYHVGNYNKITNDPLPIRQTLRTAQALASPGEPFLVGSIWRYYEAHYYQTDRNPVYLQAEDGITWGSYDMVRYDNYRKVYDVPAFAKSHGGKIWFISDWQYYGQPKMPASGKWQVLQEARVEGLSDKQSTIRAVELQLK